MSAKICAVCEIMKDSDPAVFTFEEKTDIFWCGNCYYTQDGMTGKWKGEKEMYVGRHEDINMKMSGHQKVPTQPMPQRHLTNRVSKYFKHRKGIRGVSIKLGGSLLFTANNSKCFLL